MDISSDGGMGEEVNHRILEAKKAWGELIDVWKKKHISRGVKVGMHKGITEPSFLHGCEGWTLKVCERKRMEEDEMNCLRNICGLRRIDRVPNVEIRRSEKNVGVSHRIDQGVLWWFGHVERMGDERMVKRVYEFDVRGVKRRGRLKSVGWME